MEFLKSKRAQFQIDLVLMICIGLNVAMATDNWNLAAAAFAFSVLLWSGFIRPR